MPALSILNLHKRKDLLVQKIKQDNLFLRRYQNLNVKRGLDSAKKATMSNAPLQVPVPCGNGVNKALRDARLLAHVLVHVKRRGAVGLGEVHVCLFLEFAVELLELVLMVDQATKER